MSMANVLDTAGVAGRLELDANDEEAEREADDGDQDLPVAADISIQQAQAIGQQPSGASHPTPNKQKRIVNHGTSVTSANFERTDREDLEKAEAEARERQAKKDARTAKAAVAAAERARRTALTAEKRVERDRLAQAKAKAALEKKQSRDEAAALETLLMLASEPGARPTKRARRGTLKTQGETEAGASGVRSDPSVPAA
jgi:hypothetical protein